MSKIKIQSNHIKCASQRLKLSLLSHSLTLFHLGHLINMWAHFQVFSSYFLPVGPYHERKMLTHIKFLVPKWTNQKRGCDKNPELDFIVDLIRKWNLFIYCKLHNWKMYLILNCLLSKKKKKLINHHYISDPNIFNLKGGIEKEITKMTQLYG